MLYCPKCGKVEAGSAIGRDITILCSDCQEEHDKVLQKAESASQVSFASPGSDGLLGLGVFILIAGFIAYMLAAPKMDIFKSGLGQLATGLNQSTANQFQMWQYIYHGSIVAIIVGGLFFLGGIMIYAQRR